MTIDRARLGRRFDDLSRIGGRGTSMTRLGLSAEEQAARDLVGAWLSARGARVRRDAAANLYARLGGDGPAVLVGSHLDSVPEGGRFDGALGVLCAVEATESLLDAGVALRRPVEIVAWADEEGARFGIGLFGSSAAFGRLPPGAAHRADRSGTTIADALRALGESGDLEEALRPPGSAAAYLELHIEQGPRLADAGAALGVVSDVVAIFHGRVTVAGRAGHAGASAMTERFDALSGAAEMVLALETAARETREAVATVGEIGVRPGAKNVVPGECTFTLDVRAPAAERLEAVLRRFRERARAIGDARGLTSRVEVLASVPAVPLDPSVRDLLSRCAARAAGREPPVLVSGAGHDAANAQLAGVASGMLFIRSTGGSHTPTEHASIEDAALGAEALALAMRELA